MTFDLEAMRQDREAGLAGPWEWGGYPDELALRTIDRGKLHVMIFCRKGFHGAQPCFQTAGRMLPAGDKLVEFEVGDRSVRGEAEAKGSQTVYRRDVRAIDHPDARRIARVPDMEAEIDRLTAENAALRAACSAHQRMIDELRTEVGLARQAAEDAEADAARLREAGAALLQVHDGLPMTGVEATRRGENMRAALATPAQAKPISALADVAAERRRQIEVEGWTPEHDDAHDKGEMARAAAAYALAGTPVDEALYIHGRWVDLVRDIVWPRLWDERRLKLAGDRRNLVKAGALILAEIERLDRLATPAQESRS